MPMNYSINTGNDTMLPSRNSSCTILPTRDETGPVHDLNAEVKSEWIPLQTMAQASRSAVGKHVATSRPPHHNNDDTPSLNIDADSSTSSYDGHPSSFPVPLHEPRFEADNDRQHQLSFRIQHEAGDIHKIYPKLSLHVFEHAKSYKTCYREIHPGSFLPDNFKNMWTFNTHQLDDPFFLEETEYRGIVYRIKVHPRHFNGPIQRGSSFIIKKRFSQLVRYFATIRRGMNEYGSISYVQLNAYSKHQDLLSATSPFWPTLLLEVPSHLCIVPMPKELYPYYKTLIAPPPTFVTQCLVKVVRDILGRREYSRYPNLSWVEFM